MTHVSIKYTWENVGLKESRERLVYSFSYSIVVHCGSACSFSRSSFKMINSVFVFGTDWTQISASPKTSKTSFKFFRVKFRRGCEMYEEKVCDASLRKTRFSIDRDMIDNAKRFADCLEVWWLYVPSWCNKTFYDYNKKQLIKSGVRWIW